MTTPVSFEEVLRLARLLSPAEQVRLRSALPSISDENAEQALQRQKNQPAIDLLDAWRAEATAAPSENADDDDWWETFKRDIDAYRLSSRPLFPDQTEPR